MQYCTQLDLDRRAWHFEDEDSGVRAFFGFPFIPPRRRRQTDREFWCDQKCAPLGRTLMLSSSLFDQCIFNSVWLTIQITFFRTVICPFSDVETATGEQILPRIWSWLWYRSKREELLGGFFTLSVSIMQYFAFKVARCTVVHLSHRLDEDTFRFLWLSFHSDAAWFDRAPPSLRYYILQVLLFTLLPKHSCPLDPGR